MKIATYRHEDQIATHLGILTDRGMVALGTLNLDGGEIPDEMIPFIEVYPQLKDSLEAALSGSDLVYIPLETLKLESPIPYPRRNVFCLGKNYLDHAEEIKSLPGAPSQVPQHPIYFTKAAYPSIGTEDVILNHKEITSSLDYEVELAIILGKKGKNIPAEDALDYIFGYTIGNDISVRNIQMKHTQWFKGKSMDTCCPLGPAIVTREDIPFPPDLAIRSFVNGQIRQDSRTSMLIFDIPTIISDLSQGLTLYPGDVILTGTPAGVGFGFDPPKTLNPGDEICCEIEAIGRLVNYVEK